MEKVLIFLMGVLLNTITVKTMSTFINLVHHKQDFGMPADWHFFAFPHGKGKLLIKVMALNRMAFEFLFL